MSELTAEQVDGLTTGIQSATEALEQGRKDMDAANTRTGKLLAEQEKLKKQGSTNGEAIKTATQKLADLASQMEGLAAQHTDLTNRVRGQMKNLADSDHNQAGEFCFRRKGGKGAIFQSRQEALELGYYFMATMKRENAGRKYARGWLAERGRQGDLRYLPQIPDSFLRDFGAEWATKVQESIRQHGLQRIEQDLAGDVTPGSILVRPEFSGTLLRNVEEYGVFRQNALIWPMGSDTVYIPRRSAGVTFYWVDQAGAITESDPTIQQLGMVAKKGAMLHQYSSELGEDAAIAIADILMFEFALAIATKEDQCGFLGDATATYAGMWGVLGAAANATAATADSTFVPHLVTGAAGNDLTTEITAAKLREMTGRLHTWARGGAKWYMHRSVHADCDGIQMGTAGGSVVRYQDPASPAIMGCPIVDTEAVPASPSSTGVQVFSLGDLRKSWILGDRRSTEIQTSEHYAFNTDQLTVRVTTRFGVLMAHGNGMVVYKTGSA